MQKSST